MLLYYYYISTVFVYFNIIIVPMLYQDRLPISIGITVYQSQCDGGHFIIMYYSTHLYIS